MSLVLRVTVIVLCLLFLAYVVRLIVRQRLQLRYALLWFLLTLVAAVFAVFPGPVFALGRMLGFESPSNFIFVVAIFFLLVLSLSLSVVVSWQGRYIKDLVQEIALIKNKMESGKHE